MADKDKKDVNVEIVRLASDGTGVGYIEGKTVFVPGMLPGEKGKIHINEVKKNYLKAEVLKIETFAEDRQHPPCTSYSECGGCSLQHLKYRSTLAWKKQWVEDSLQRIGGLAKVKVDEVIGMENPWRYRNKAVLHKGLNGKFGYYQEKSNNVVDFSDCMLLSEMTIRRIKEIQKVIGECGAGIKTVTFRESNKGEGLILLEGSTGDKEEDKKLENKFRTLKKEELFSPQSCSISLFQKNTKLEGSGPQYFYEYLNDLRFRVSPRAFLQVNPRQTARLYSLVLNWAELSGKEDVWDLYCGIGTITLMLAQRAKRAIGIEENPDAIKDAEENAKDNGITNVKYIQGKVEDKIKGLTKLVGSPEKLGLVVADPPRAGIERGVIDQLLKILPQKIIYVSCNPATLARDLKVLTQGNGQQEGSYCVKKVQPIDMFPWTGHVECVVLMSRLAK